MSDINPTLDQLNKLSADCEQEAIELARIDPAAFVAYTLTDEQTGGPLDIQPMHLEWHDLITKHKEIVIHAFPEAGKSLELSIGRVLWEIGNNPNIHIAIVSNTADRAEALIRAIGEHIVKNKYIKQVFPLMQPSTDSSLQWTATSLTVQRDVISKDPTLRAYGVEALVPGPRLDFVIMDDILDMENTRTIGQRDKLWTRLTSTLFTRLTKNGRMVAIGNCWHPSDAMHNMVSLAGFKGFKYPVLVNNVSIWPSKWSIERIDDMRAKLGTFEFQRMMLCIARDDNTARIKREWIDRCLARGEDITLRYAFDNQPNGRVYTGVDLAVSKASSADKTAIFTMLAHNNGDREVINIETGRWSAQEILLRVRSIVRRYGGIVLVEDNGAQDHLRQLAAMPGANDGAPLPIYPFHTSAKKWDSAYGVESIAAELEIARWIVPSKRVNGETLIGATAEINEWISDLINFDPTTHTGDVLMACVVPNTLVTTQRGLIPIQNVDRNDQVLTHKGRFRNIMTTMSRRYTGEVITIKPYGLNAITITPEHPIWTGIVNTNWKFKNAKRVKQNQNVFYPIDCNKHAFFPSKTNKHAFFLGQLNKHAFFPVPNLYRMGHIAFNTDKNWLENQQLDGHILFKRNGVAVQIESITKQQYDGLVYNFHVEEDESYVIEGIAVHNCYFAREAARKNDQDWKPPSITVPQPASKLQAILEDPGRYLRPRLLGEGDLVKARRDAERKIKKMEDERTRQLRIQVKKLGIDPNKLG